VNGFYVCRYCRDLLDRSYRGKDGDACRGFDPMTGKLRSGTLIACRGE
jgi:hypothetical protein